MTVVRIKLGEAVEILSGFAFKSEFFNDSEGMPVIRIRDVVRGFSETRYSGEFSEGYIVQDGEIIIGMDGNFNAARWAGGPALLNQRVCKIKANEGKLDDGYLFHFLPRALQKIEDATPFVTVKHLSVKDIRDIDIALPSLSEQRRIAAILDQADALRAKRREALAQVDSLTQSIFIEMFGDPARNTKGLPLISLGEVGQWKSGGTPPRKKDDYFTGSIPWFSSGELEGMYVSESIEKITSVAVTETSAKSVPKGALMLGMYDTAALKASIAGVDCSCNQAIAFSSIRKDILETVYVYYAIVIGREHFRRLQRGVRQKNLNLEMIRQIQIPFPHISTQRKFLEQVRELNDLKETENSSLQELESLFATLQHRAFRGAL